MMAARIPADHSRQRETVVPAAPVRYTAIGKRRPGTSPPRAGGEIYKQMSSSATPSGLAYGVMAY